MSYYDYYSQTSFNQPIATYLSRNIKGNLCIYVRWKKKQENKLGTRRCKWRVKINGILYTVMSNNRFIYYLLFILYCQTPSFAQDQHFELCFASRELRRTKMIKTNLFKPVFWSTNSLRYLYSFRVSFVFYWLMTGDG